jgi:hypothetical protein
MRTYGTLAAGDIELAMFRGYNVDEDERHV